MLNAFNLSHASGLFYQDLSEAELQAVELGATLCVVREPRATAMYFDFAAQGPTAFRPARRPGVIAVLLFDACDGGGEGVAER